MDFEKNIANFLKKQLGLKQINLERPSSEKMGDYSLPCFKIGSNPVKEAKTLKSKLKKPNYISKIEAVGPYLNFFIKESTLLKKTISQVITKNKNYGHKKQTKKVVVIESPGPNTNKPLHLGHVRNMLLGNSLIELNKAVGNNAIRVDIINDRGIHICKSMFAYLNYGKNKAPDKKSDHFVGDYYVLYEKKAKLNKKLNEELSKLLVKWEQKDKKVTDLWKKLNRWGVEGINKTYKRFGTKIDKTYFESNHYGLGKKIIDEGLTKGLFQKDEKGNIIVDLKKENLGEKVVMRADGTSIYITQDIILADLRNKDYSMDEMIYVVANEQEYHFKTLFEILKRLNYNFTKKLFHLSYGYISLPHGKMKSREGNIVDADTLADKMKDMAEKEIKKRNKNLPSQILRQTSEIIGMGAIKFFMLKYDPLKNFTYDPKESIKFEGETGPYLQYTGARINSILKKGKIHKKIKFSTLNAPVELSLIKQINKYPKIIEKSAREHKPSLLCNYLVELCKKFNTYYQSCKILENEESTLTNARLSLVKCTKITLGNGLKILGIDIPARM